MGLIKCPDCGNSISTAAGACPHCGRPTANARGRQSRPVVTRRAGGCFEGIGTLILISGFIMAATTSFHENQMVTMAGVLMVVVGFVIFLIGRFM